MSQVGGGVDAGSAGQRPRNAEPGTSKGAAHAAAGLHVSVSRNTAAEPAQAAVKRQS